ncbi:hypothetical protein Droror1_Dr00028009 [Drosera rotundifolia]
MWEVEHHATALTLRTSCKQTSPRTYMFWGNVLVNEDNEPAAKWLALINQALNRPSQDPVNSSCDSSHGSKSSDDSMPNFFQKPALKVIKKNLKVESRSYQDL